MAILQASVNTNAYRKRKREAKVKADSEFLFQFVKAFPGQTKFNIADIEHEDYSEPVRIKIIFQEALRPALVDYAHGLGLDVETMFDRLAEIIAARTMPDRRLFVME